MPHALMLALILIAGAPLPARADPLGAILEHRRSSVHEGLPSRGCGTEPGPPPSTIEVDGRSRQLIVALPEDYDADVTHALVIVFHGRTTAADRARRYYGLEGDARRPTLFVYPNGLPAGPGRLTWSKDTDPPDRLRDYRLFDRIVQVMDERYCIDRTRIFAVGHSLGAWFTNSLACARGDVLRAIGTVAGSISVGTCRGQTAAILLHHPLDRMVPYERGREALAALIRGPEAIQRAEVVRHAGFDCMRFDLGRDPVLFCPHGQTRTSAGQIYPHQWPDGAGRAIMRFFEQLR